MINNPRILSTGVSIPPTILTNSDIVLKYKLNIKPSWVAERLGIYERRIICADKKTSDLACEAGVSALKRSGLGPENIDLLILATATPDCQAPSTACITQGKLGLSNATAFDVSAVCCGFLYAMVIATTFIKSNHSKRVMVIGVDVFSRITDWSQRDCVFFGDGAGAIIMDAFSDSDFIFDFTLYSDGTKSNVWYIPENTNNFKMDARSVYNEAMKSLPSCIKSVLDKNAIKSEMIDLVVPHQPSLNLLKSLSEEVGINFGKFKTNMHLYGNTASATIPLALHDAIIDGDIKKDNLILFAAAGAGFTAGAALYRWN